MRIKRLLLFVLSVLTLEFLACSGGINQSYQKPTLKPGNVVFGRSFAASHLFPMLEVCASKNTDKKPSKGLCQFLFLSDDQIHDLKPGNIIAAGGPLGLHVYAEDDVILAYETSTDYSGRLVGGPRPTVNADDIVIIESNQDSGDNRTGIAVKVIKSSGDEIKAGYDTLQYSYLSKRDEENESHGFLIKVEGQDGVFRPPANTPWFVPSPSLAEKLKSTTVRQP
jgi:hypothetical protein